MKQPTIKRKFIFIFCKGLIKVVTQFETAKIFSIRATFYAIHTRAINTGILRVADL